MADKKTTGYITFGPKDNFASCVQIYYTPTPEQIADMRKYFGWDYVTEEELNEIDKTRYGG